MCYGAVSVRPSDTCWYCIEIAEPIELIISTLAILGLIFIVKVKVKASHTRYGALSPELIPMYRHAVSPQVTGGRLPLLSARPAVTSPAAEHHRPLAGTKLYCLVTEAHRCKQLAKGCYAALPRAGFEVATY